MIWLGIFILLAAWSSVFSRMAGGGLWPARPPGFGEALFVLPIAVMSMGPWWAGGLWFAWSYLWMQTGHVTAYHMANKDGPDYYAQGRRNVLDYVVAPVFKAFGWPVSSWEPRYCWAFMALKGFLIHAPLGLWAFPAALLWPTAYWLGNVWLPKVRRDIDGEMVAEFLAGAFSGAVVAISLT